MTKSLHNRSVLVTGASKGIGKGIARVFAQAGAKVALLARNLQAAEAAAQEIGHDSFAVAADVTSYASLEAATAEIIRRTGALDVLCANAGIFPQAPIANMSEHDWDEVIAVNIKGTFLSVKACLPHLKKSNQARIILTSSITGPVTGYPGWAHYGATKAAQLGFMRTACLEFAPCGITVNAVLPGNIATEGLAGLGPDYEKTMSAAIPLGRLGSVEDIGHAALFLASKEAAFITGQTLIVDGGQTLPEST